ncbi:MAG: hypothetical protein APF80_10125 [Alphaproteobacteria bacterium BRH_c36]|nr:MAG: hypothetical protein APF80_10125 [Alphaproteobacteria bacterium BRH_c36]
MLDKPDKTARFVAMLKAALPFEVELLASTLARLRECNPDMRISRKETVFEVTYELSHGGIICLNGTDNLVATALTHVRVHPTLPFAATITDYQRHRRKNLRKRQQLLSPVTLTLRHGQYRGAV